MTETFTTPEGLTLSFERRGTGPLLVCHPGGPGGSAAEFRDFAGHHGSHSVGCFGGAEIFARRHAFQYG